KEWDWNYNDSSDLSDLIFPTTGFGTLYPPNCFYQDVIDNNIFQKLSSNADDVWLFWMCRLNNVKFKVVGGETLFCEWEGTSNDGLWRTNLLKGENDKYIKNMISHYGFVGGGQTNNSRSSISKDLFSFAYANKMVRMYLPNNFD